MMPDGSPNYCILKFPISPFFIEELGSTALLLFVKVATLFID
jgi:hypothetical protein